MDRLTSRWENNGKVEYTRNGRSSVMYEDLKKLGMLEDLLENADYIRIIKRNGIASLHIDMILDNETYPIAEQLFGKEKVEDYDK